MKKIIIFILVFVMPFLNALAQDTIGRNNFYFKDCSQRHVVSLIDLNGTETWYWTTGVRDTVTSGGEQIIRIRKKTILWDSALNAIDSVLLPPNRYPIKRTSSCGKGYGSLMNTYKIGDCFYHASVYLEECRIPDQDYDGIKIDSIAFETFNRTTGAYTCVSYPLNTPEARFNEYMQHFHMGGDKFGVILSHAKPTGDFYTQPWEYLGDSSRFIIYQISRGIVKDTTLPIPCAYVFHTNNAALIGNKIAFFALSEFDRRINPKGDLYLIDTSDFSFQGIYDSLDNNEFQLPFVDRRGAPYRKLDLQQVNDSTVVDICSAASGGGQRDYVTPFIFSIPDWKLKHIVKIPIGRRDLSEHQLTGYEKYLGVHGDTVIYAFGQMAADQISLGFNGVQEIRVVSFSASTGEIFSDVFLDFPHGIKTVVGNVLSTQNGGISFVVLNDLNLTDLYCYLVNYNPRRGVSLREVSSGESVRLHVYPNPAKDFVTVDFHGELVGKAVFEIHDMQGRKVLQQEFSQPLGNKVNVSGLQPGAYSYKLYFNGKAIGEKIIIGQ